MPVVSWLVRCACNYQGAVLAFVWCRYLIQNLTGSDLWYWAGQPSSSQGRAVAQHRVYLPAYAMQELKVCLAVNMACMALLCKLYGHAVPVFVDISC